jgi:hypothetical protein
MLTVVALICFANPWGAAQAQPPAPPAFKCDATDKMFKDGNGTNDNFVTTGTADPKPHPSALFVSTMSLTTTNIYDQATSNYKFGETFKLPAGQVTKIRVTTRLKPLTGQPDNDGISFSTKPNFTPGHFSFSLSSLAPPWTSGQAAKLFVFDFGAPGSTIQVNGAASSPAVTVPAMFYTDITANPNHEIHIYQQDDSSVDFVQIEACVKPLPPKYDLVASKKHDGNVYLLNVHNAGSQIMPSGKVDVTEVVPAGLVILSASGAPWQCPGVIFPVVGPDAFICSYQIPAGGIAANSSLPTIILKTEGKSECPNCMRVKLFLKSVSDGVKPVEEGDMKNNASCTM